MKRLKLIAITIACVILLCYSSHVYAETEVLLMATSTSVDNSGLLDYLSPYFTRDTEIKLKWLITGSGKALQLGKECNVEVLFVHAPQLEMEYLKETSCIERAEVMYNNLMLIGPTVDPANIEGMDIFTALLTIKNTRNIFVSRGDNSGTHICEINLWEEAGVDSIFDVDESWYIEIGEGMLATVNFCAKIGAYTIVDEGTYLKYMNDLGNTIPLKVFIKGGKKLINYYSILVVNPENCSNRNFENADSFLKWIIGDSAQKLIQNFNLKGQYLFIPNAK